MAITKNRKDALSKFDTEKVYDLEEASQIVKDITKLKFDSSVDIAVRLGVDPKKANQMVRGTVSLPHGTGKDVKVLVLCSPDKEKEATDAGADFVGLDEYIDKIKQGWTDVDVIITLPSVMGKVGALGRILGPRILPNAPTLPITEGIVMITSTSVQPFLILSMYSSNPTKSAPASFASFSLSGVHRTKTLTSFPVP